MALSTTPPEDDLTGHADATPHRAADDTEQVYFAGSPMLRGELAKGWPWLLVGLLVLAAPIVIKLLAKEGTTNIAWWVYVAAFVIGLLILLVPWMKTKTVRYKITNYRIDIERGLLSRKIDTLELWHVEDIRMEQSILERILGVGTVTVFSHDDTTPQLPMRGLPNPRPLFDSLKQRVIAVKRQRGVVKMDIG